jgi:hypothetical protein
MGLTRRRLLTRAGLGVTALAAARPLAAARRATAATQTAATETTAATRAAAAAPAGATRAGSGVVWRGVALGPGGVGDTQLYRTNRRFFGQTGTPWVRFWADWPTLQPERTLAPDRGSGAAALARLDQGIDAARADGRKVILTAWRFPRWANGTDAIGPVRDIGFELQDRVALGADPARRKDLTFRLPADLSPGSDWAAWIDFLITRYRDRIDALELLNEPNLQLWPQRGIAAATASMFISAQTVASRHVAPPLLAGPATADRTGDDRLSTAYDTFTADLLAELDARDFTAGPGFAWSHHSYADLENELTGGANRTAAVRALLEDRWRGWPAADPAAPGILITETGARLDVLAKLYGLSDPAAIRHQQAELLERYFRRMQFDPEGEGVGMVCQYLFVTDEHYDAGLCDLDGSPRPAYEAWGRLPAFT